MSDPVVPQFAKATVEITGKSAPVPDAIAKTQSPEAPESCPRCSQPMRLLAFVKTKICDACGYQVASLTAEVRQS